MSGEGVKVSAGTRERVRLGARLYSCNQQAFVDAAVDEYLKTHSAEIQAGLENARRVLLFEDEAVAR